MSKAVCVRARQRSLRSGSSSPDVLQVEPAVKRAPLNDRKKRKFGDIDSAVQSEAAAAETTGAAPKATLHEAHPAPAASAAAPSKPSTVRVSSKVSARASKKARKLNDGPKPAANPKQRLVRTVAVGNLDSKTKQEAVTLAQAAGKVRWLLDTHAQKMPVADSLSGYRLTSALLLASG